MGRSTHSERTTAWAAKHAGPGYRAKKIVPSADELNGKVNKSSLNKTMKLTIYTSPYCPYCHMVESFVAENNITVTYKNTLELGIKQELIDLGGKGQVPFLRDQKKDIQMYESQDIINYLEENYV